MLYIATPKHLFVVSILPDKLAKPLYVLFACVFVDWTQH